MPAFSADFSGAEMTVIDLLEPIRAASLAAVPEFAARGAVLEGLPAGTPSSAVLGEESALSQVFLNLLLNAAHALAPGGRARIELGADSGNIIVTVRDEGSGMSRQGLGQVLELFFDCRSPGSPMGLAIARQIVLGHGGTIAIESAPGQGTTVCVTLRGMDGVGTHRDGTVIMM